MHNWKYPNKDILPKELSETSNETLLQMEAEIKSCNEHNEKILKSLIKAREQMLESATFIFGVNSKPVKYLKKQTINQPSRFNFSEFKQSFRNAKKEKEDKNRDLENSNKKDTLTINAINWLTERGFTPGNDFTTSNAISIANSVAFDEEVWRRTDKIRETRILIEFNGDNACENCSGWDGESHRCECGNRRVYWDRNFYDGYFLDPDVYGQAD